MMTEDLHCTACGYAAPDDASWRCYCDQSADAVAQIGAVLAQPEPRDLSEKLTYAIALTKASLRLQLLTAATALEKRAVSMENGG